MSEDQRWRAIAAWTRSYEAPLAVAAGATVTVGARDTDWPDFLWCRDAVGREGWLPEQILAVQGNTGRVREDYDAIELTVAPDEVLTGDRALAGWVWCRNQAGREGWVPERVLNPADS